MPQFHWLLIIVMSIVFLLILGTFTPKETNNVVETPSPQTNLGNNDLNMLNTDILSSIRKRGILNIFLGIFFE